MQATRLTKRKYETLHVFCEGEKLKATRQSYHGILEKKLEGIATISNEIIERGSNDSTATSLLDCMRKYLQEDELVTFKTDAWKESRRLGNETILEPNEWQEKQNEHELLGGCLHVG